jgi:hypothetical protein
MKKNFNKRLIFLLDLKKKIQQINYNISHYFVIFFISIFFLKSIYFTSFFVIYVKKKIYIYEEKLK